MNHRNEPEFFLHICGFMNEYMQEFMLTHDFHVMNVNEGPNPDNMSYEVVYLGIAATLGARREHRQGIEGDIQRGVRETAPEEEHQQRHEVIDM